MTFEWAREPGYLVLLALAVYRTTWAWLKAMLPPLPWVRTKLKGVIERRNIAPYLEADGSMSTEQARHWSAYINRTGGQPTLSYLVTCFSCAGFWVGAGWVLAASLLPRPVWLIPAGALALSAVAGLLSPDHE